VCAVVVVVVVGAEGGEGEDCQNQPIASEGCGLRVWAELAICSGGTLLAWWQQLDSRSRGYGLCVCVCVW